MPPEAAEHASVLLMRHGETDWNIQRRIMGQAAIPLNANGVEQARVAARALARLGVESIIASPLLRAVQTADIVAEESGARVVTDARLGEVQFGRWQGMTFEQIREDPDYEAFLEDPIRRPTPGGETIEQVQLRALAVVEELPPGSRALLISHGDIIRSTLCHYLGLALEEFRRIRVDNCAISSIGRGFRGPEVKFVNVVVDEGRAWNSSHWQQAS
jgi:broad specificity phosphatase PhoE